MTEYEIVEDCYTKLLNMDNIKEVHLEIPYMSKVIDMVIIENNNRIITIEFKLQNWRKALNQAKVHKYGADEAYICMPEPKQGFKKEFIKLLKKKGIGLFKYDSKKQIPFEKIVDAREEANRWQPRIDLLKEMIAKVKLAAQENEIAAV
ncbi:hypothetical protein [Halanaerobium congolense]|jgi:ABC-type uncharacterized transport system permease subunit|uniref:PD-(D/E)XK nuclease superfamily protein n=1 Tax=Halanaerobium congolense TaxID=54121 RepID=A0A318DXL5_9FIRM|nr:hypothetical protein [Halanaerobium congolense]PXV62140.1 hypothetical protein C8C78_13811 [Halanaerobium congolense]TDX36498.1 hypothetical protein C7954_14813 [Halanaerobium congolense]SDH61282.1 hypothetical protein SAMN04515651_11847 [Halanaerobium congolense]